MIKKKILSATVPVPGAATRRLNDQDIDVAQYFFLVGIMYLLQERMLKNKSFSRCSGLLDVEKQQLLE